MTDFVEKLRAIVGERGLITDEPGKHPYLTDWRENYLGAALAVVRPATTEEVAAVVKLCAAEKVAIVPAGRQHRHDRAAARRTRRAARSCCRSTA